MEWLSASKLKKFRKCPYSLQEKFTESPATKFGTAVHAGIAEWFKQNEQYFTEGYLKQARMLMVPTTKDPEAANAIDFAKSLGIDRDSVITVESEDGGVEYFGKHYFEVPFTDKWGIRGAMDLVFVDDEGNLNIVDWKTGMSKEDDDLQLAIYALCAWKKYGAFPCIRTSFVYVQQNCVQSSAWDAESLVSALAYLEPLAAEYLEETNRPKIAWKQTPHSNCRYCSLQNECTQFNRQLQEPPEQKAYELDATLENLPRLLDYKEKIEAISKASAYISDLLKGKIENVLSDNGGKVVFNNRTIQLKEKICSYDYDLPAIFVQAQEMANGKVPFEICKYNAAGGKLFCKSLDSEKKKQFDLIVESNRTVKTKTKTIAVSISKEPVLEDNSGAVDE